MTAARRPRVAPTPAEFLRTDITDICAQIDRRLGNPPGTAEHGLYFWWWPPGGVDSLDVLQALHTDALRFLLNLANPEGPQ
jgi:hypothetical protein